MIVAGMEGFYVFVKMRMILPRISMPINNALYGTHSDLHLVS